MIRNLHRFFQSDVSGGVILMFAAVAAMLIANSPLFPVYQDFLGPSLFWINDLLMAFFFLLAGIEIKREVMAGALSTPSRALLPAVAAAGGMLVPALVYLGFNVQTPQFNHGWAIPSATDIAFALGVLALVSSRVPLAIKVLLTAIAVIDDLGAILIIAFFYTEQMVPAALGICVLAAIALLVMNWANVRAYAAYFFVGAILWVAMLYAGVHPTLAGVLLALAIPTARLDALEHVLKPWVVFGVLPLFGFANAGVSLAGIGLGDLLHPVSLGIGLGLFIGKQVGILGSMFLLVKTGLCALPDGVNWRHVYGMSLLCGIGFTMALFIGGLAFEDPAMAAYVRMGVMGGSLLSGLLGFAVLYKTAQK